MVPYLTEYEVAPIELPHVICKALPPFTPTVVIEKLPRAAAETSLELELVPPALVAVTT